MRQMMRSFSEPFGGPMMPSITDGRSRGRDMAEHPSSSVALRNEHRVRMGIFEKDFKILSGFIFCKYELYWVYYSICYIYVHPNSDLHIVCVCSITDKWCTMTLWWAYNQRILLFGGCAKFTEVRVEAGPWQSNCWTTHRGMGPCESLVLWKGNPLGLSGQLYLALRSPIYRALFHWHTIFK